MQVIRCRIRHQEDGSAAHWLRAGSMGTSPAMRGTLSTPLFASSLKMTCIQSQNVSGRLMRQLLTVVTLMSTTCQTPRSLHSSSDTVAMEPRHLTELTIQALDIFFRCYNRVNSIVVTKYNTNCDWPDVTGGKYPGEDI